LRTFFILDFGSLPNAESNSRTVNFTVNGKTVAAGWCPAQAVSGKWFRRRDKTHRFPWIAGRLRESLFEGWRRRAPRGLSSIRAPRSVERRVRRTRLERAVLWNELPRAARLLINTLSLPLAGGPSGK
jgi:hypothetical protein